MQRQKKREEFQEEAKGREGKSNPRTQTGATEVHAADAVVILLGFKKRMEWEVRGQEGSQCRQDIYGLWSPSA